ncbi:hypothetical protein ACFL3T_00920 [Patescibacteria group bacterium]
MDLKAKLQQLIKSSATLQSLPPEELKFRADAMLSADDAAMTEFIKILETESAQIKKIDDDFAKKAGELNDLVAEANQLEKEANTMFRKEEEEEERGAEEQKAEDLLKKLDEV